MFSNSLSLRGSLSLIIALMGIIGLCLAIATGEIYRQLILDHEKNALRDLLRLETSTLLREHHNTVRDFGLDIQNDFPLEQGIKHTNLTLLNKTLTAWAQTHHDHKHDYLGLEQLYLYDTSLQLLASSDTTPLAQPIPICGSHAKSLRRLPPEQRLKPPDRLCEHQQRLYASTIVPIGAPEPAGFLQIISNPLPALPPIATTLGLPIQIRRGNEIVFESAVWPDSNRQVQLESSFTLAIDSEAEHPSPVIIGIKRDITEMERELDQTRIYIMLVSGLITALAIAVFLFIINRTTLAPLSRLSRQLRKLRDDKSHLGEKIQPRGNIEIQELTSDFNAMTTELDGMYETLEDLAFRDELTSLPNRSRLQEILIYHTRQNRENAVPFALFMMDLDHFKTVNDTLGHHAGDRLLQQVSERLTSCLRKTDSLAQLEDTDKALLYQDMVARLGGDEFAAVLPTVEKEQDAMVVARKIQRAMDKPFEIEGCNFSVGISIGIVLCPEHGNDNETLMRRADVAMYQAKSERLGAKLYDPEQDHHSVEMLTLGDELKKAISSNQLELYYQPKVDLKKQRLIGVEALLRWQHPERGFVPPDQFVAVAEQTGLIHSLTEWVVHTGLRALSNWHQAQYRFGIAINLSTKNLLNADLINCIQTSLRKYCISPRMITLEITETTIMSDPTRALAVLRQLYNAGINISIDDFGTGYSSLSYLKDLPVTELKIDRSFVMDMLTESSDATLVRSIIDLAKNMGLQVTAEGIENSATLHHLQTLDCDLGQGYHIARPMPEKELLLWLETSEWHPPLAPPKGLSA